MEEIKVGEYVRDEDGCIIKVDEIQDYEESEQDTWYKAENTINGTWNRGTWKSMITKHSPNIIDLIEVGDYVNGCKVIDICESLYSGEKVIYIGGFRIPKKIYDNQIKSIVTKEQFESVEYKLEE